MSTSSSPVARIATRGRRCTDQLGTADRRRHRDDGMIHASAARDHRVALVRFRSGSDDILAGSHRALHSDDLSLALRELHHHHGVCAGGNGSAGHDLDCLARVER